MVAVAGLPLREAGVLKGHEGAVLAVRFNGDGNYCLSCGKDRTLRLWNPHRGIHIKTYKSHGREVRDVHVTPDNAKLVSCGGDRQIFYWDVSTGRVIRKFRGHDSEVNSVKFNEYASVVVSAGYDQSVRAWDCRSHSTEPIQIIDTFQDSVMSVCLTKSEIIAGSVDGTVRTFDIRIGRELVDDLKQPVNCVSLSNDTNCVLASCLDSTLRLLDRSSGELLQEYKGHTCKSFKMDCCLTNSDAHVTSGSEDGFIYFWDLADASVVSKFRAHASVEDERIRKNWLALLKKIAELPKVISIQIIALSEDGFNAAFSYFINSERFTHLTFNSVIILTFSAAIIACQPASDDSSETSGGKYMLGFILTLAASVTYCLNLSLMELTFHKIIKCRALSVVLNMQIYTALVSTVGAIIGLFASGEWRELKKDMEGFNQGRLSYVMTLVWTSICWQVTNVGLVGLIFEVSSLFSNVISSLAVPIAPVFAVILFHDTINGIKVMSLLCPLLQYSIVFD